MKKVIALTMCAVCLLAACTPAAKGEMVKPGDQIGDFLITTGEDALVTWEQDCTGGVSTTEANVISCNASTGTSLMITTGIYDDAVSSIPATATPHLEELWSTFTYDLTIDGRPVDLQAFGHIEFVHPQVGVIRYWNVAIVSEQPGEIIVRESGVVDGEPFAYVTTYKITLP